VGSRALDAGLMKTDNYELNAWNAQHFGNHKFIYKERDKE